MKLLFLHRNFPGQFRYMASYYAGNSGNTVVFLATAVHEDIPGVHKVIYRPEGSSRPTTHIYLRGFEDAVLYGQSACRAAIQLREQGFIPDLIIGHSGWGPTLYVQDVYPDVPLLCYFEWFYRSHGSTHGFDPATPVSEDNKAEIRTKNMAIMLDLCHSTLGLSPTRWQKQQFPPEFHNKIQVIHDGVNTALFCPAPEAKLVIPRIGLDLSEAEEIVTYVATGMEPMRGFPQFMEAVSLLQKRRPRCHVVVVGEDRVEYSNPLANGKTYKQWMLEQYEYDLTRIHFTGRLNLLEYREVIQASTVHVYLTYPYILSWSLLEAMACGCLVIGSNTPPVAEVIEDGGNGLLVDFFSPRELADKIDGALNDPGACQLIRRNARNTILEKYSLDVLFPKQRELVQALVDRRA
ncbi:MAG TPA: glycosyltransferase family 4 protein [Methylomusa anaerophila]|uniref:Putative glycosyltransferase EpsD n=1 Tax=Methylomusa anaerophila TaxID=1930071 RepID=A0A348AKR0_9FIRM|nr:glycosyltransferase family 4 protein [Methylomusa anaerophila]BBB91658.1 putative glycosyltransferase EpsD [Methylomusa anaerophila]HML88608.1 glycosyltransferase family 4 protein [Methylomusa anaerophila]